MEQVNISEIEKICNSFPGVTQDIKWENHLCFCVGEKMFIITSPDEFPVNASFKTSREEFEKLSVAEGFKPAAYLARYNWIHVDDIRRINYKQWHSLLKIAYQLVFEKLPKRTQSIIPNH